MSTSPPLAQLRAESLFSLAGKVAVVTGGSRGMGKEICRAYAAAGADLLIASRKRESCDELAKHIQQESPGRRVLTLACNVGKWQDCQALYEFAYDKFGHVDVLVNNAGGSPLYPSLLEISEDYVDKILGLNLKGPFRLAALFASRMCAQDGGSIINVSSNSSVNPSPNAAVYAAAKAGLNNLTASLAHAYGPKVRVNCIMPGPFLTDISKAWQLKPMTRAWRAKGSLMRAGRADEIVGAALYLATDASSFTTGAVLTVDGQADAGAPRDPYHKKNLDYEKDVYEKMRDTRLSKL